MYIFSQCQLMTCFLLNYSVQLLYGNITNKSDHTQRCLIFNLFLWLESIQVESMTLTFAKLAI